MRYQGVEEAEELDERVAVAGEEINCIFGIMRLYIHWNPYQYWLHVSLLDHFQTESHSLLASLTKAVFVI